MLAIVIVNYKNEEKTISYIKEEIIIKVSVPYVIVVVNNAADIDSNFKLEKELGGLLIDDIQRLQDDKKNIFIVPHSDNLGFAKGNNLGVKFCLNHFKINWILFSNNDIRLRSSNVVEELIKKLDELSDIALIGPKVLGLNGEKQSPEPYKSLFNRYVSMFWLTPFISKKSKIKLFKLNYSDLAEEGIHYKIMGSFFIVKSADFLKCGMMDPNTFLYAEEVILAERLKLINKYAYYYPTVEILHEHSQTISTHLNRKKIILTQFSSESYYYKTYKSISSIKIFLAKISLLFYLALKGLK